MPSGSQDKAFAENMDSFLSASLSTAALDGAIEWISNNLSPDDVFTTKDLESWAENNGYIKE